MSGLFGPPANDTCYQKPSWATGTPKTLSIQGRAAAFPDGPRKLVKDTQTDQCPIIRNQMIFIDQEANSQTVLEAGSFPEDTGLCLAVLRGIVCYTI